MKNAVQSLAKQADYERYLCSLFAPSEVRPSIWAAISFAAEVMRIPAIVSEEMIGLVRLKWWCEELSKPNSNNPILQSLQPYPELIPYCVALCEAVGENIGAADLSAIKAIMRSYFALLAYAANEAQSIAQYHHVADLCSEIAMARTSSAPIQISHQPIATKQTPYLRKMEHLFCIWQKTLRKNPHANIINALAIKLCAHSFIFSLRK